MTVADSDRHVAKSLTLIGIAVTILAAAIGLFAGIYAGLLYWLDVGDSIESEGASRIMLLGAFLGTLGSAAAGVKWSVIMLRRAGAEQAQALVLQGAALGARLGVYATALLHFGLILMALVVEIRVLIQVPMFLGIGVVCGIVSGCLLGAFGGWLCRLAVRSAVRVQDVAAPTDVGQNESA